MKILRSISRRLVRQLAKYRIISPETAALWLYRIVVGRKADMANPKDLNEKILWLEFNTDTTKWSELSDKIAVYDYVRARGLEDILLPIYGVYDTADEISFEQLPDSFVIKSNNGWAQTIIVRDKSAEDEAKIKRTTAQWLKSGFSTSSAEPHYSRIRPKLLAQQLIPTKDGVTPVDYKFMCFGGKPEYCLVCTERNTDNFNCKLAMYSLPDWKSHSHHIVEDERDCSDIPRPENLDEMIGVAAALSENFPFVRVDLYNNNGKIWFGEMTFTPAAARITYFDSELMLALGQLIEI
ncbi:MAG: hypothetical protein NC098_09465 [Lachnoclostridium sp.]|nr:hypothetical protein [Lachnoclostridium sp.]